MKATQRDFAAKAPRAAREARIFFLCGPDEAGVQDAANRIVALLDSPGERIDMTGAELKKDPVRLDDEARSTSLFGETRHIWIRAQGDEAHDAVKILLDSDVATSPVLIQATGATDKSRTAKLLADRADALVAMFWPPDAAHVATMVRQMADAAGLRLTGDMAGRIARGCNNDTRIVQAEITKLAVYLDASQQSPRQVDQSALDAVIATTEDDSFKPLVNAVLSGDTARLPGELRRMREQGINPVGLLLAIERRAAQLAQLAARLEPRVRVADLVEREVAARRIPLGDKGAIIAQLERWRGARLARLVDKLIAMHRTLLGNSQHAELMLAQGLAEITRVAAR